MIVYNVNLDSWCEKHGIKPFVATCPDCENDIPVDKPFMEIDRVGLISLPCECGCENEPQIFRYRDPNHPLNNINPFGDTSTTIRLEVLSGDFEEK